MQLRPGDAPRVRNFQSGKAATMPTVDKKTGVITDDTEAAADAAENEHERPEGWIAPTVTDDGEPEPEHEDGGPKNAPEPESAPLTQKQLEALGKRIDTAATKHENELRRILGDDFAEWLPCPLCMTDGHFAPMPAEQRDPAQVDAVLSALGMGGPEMLQPDDRYVECEGCHGFGQRRTPSKRAEHQVVNCDDCASRGYHEKRATPIATAPAWQPPPPPPVAQFVPIVGGQPDPYGKPAGHPQWGIDLNAVG